MSSSPDGPLRSNEAAAPSHQIIVIHAQPDKARDLKELIEFMDAPHVLVASPADWRERLTSARLAAVFVSRQLGEADVRDLIGSIGEFDRNVPIVLINGE